jgi:hypothetical protein
MLPLGSPVGCAPLLSAERRQRHPPHLLINEEGVPLPRNTVAEHTRTTFERFLRAVQGVEACQGHHGRYGRTGVKHQNTQETGRGSIDQVATGWPASPRGRMSDETFNLFVNFFVCLFVALFVCIVL